MIQDSGDRREFEINGMKTGAVRDMAEGKGRCDLLPACAVLRLAKHFENGAKKYNDRNWEKGIPIHSFIDSAIRHLMKYLDGWDDEDHLCAAAWNCMCCLWTEEKMPHLQDIPTRREKELWRETRYKGYEVSSLGRVKNKETECILKGAIDKKGYPFVCLSAGKNQITKRVHRLVADAFLPNPNELPEINHIDGNKQNNTIFNLEWCSHADNVKHSIDTGLKPRVTHRKLTDEDIAYIKKNCIKGDAIMGVRAIAKRLNVSHTTVKETVNGKRWKGKPELQDIPTRKEEEEHENE